MLKFKKGDRVIVRAASHLVGTVECTYPDYWGKKGQYLVDIGPRGGPLVCEGWELEPATALDDLVNELDLDGIVFDE